MMQFAPTKRRAAMALGIALFSSVFQSARGADVPDPAPPPVTGSGPAKIAANGDWLDEFLAAWKETSDLARATQPTWSTPLTTSTALLEQRFRFDTSFQHAGNGAETTALDGGKGFDFIVSETNEIQIGLSPYDIRTASLRGPAVKAAGGFADTPFIRIKQRLVSSPSDQDNYIVSAWLQVQAPTGITAFTSNAWTLLPTLAFGKGWGPFDIQGTVGGSLPTSNAGTIGDQIQSNVAFQYHVGELFWPEVEVNWSYYANGQRGGLNQIYLTPGFLIGRFALIDGIKSTVGIGYQIAVSPDYRFKPQTPSYQDALVVSSRLNF